MPVELASAFQPETFAKVSPRYSNAEQKSGSLDLVGPDGSSSGVQVKIYRTSLEHFAVIYPRAKHCKPLGVLNLKNTTCQRHEEMCGVVLRQRGFDNTVAITFLSDYPSELESWVSAFTWKVQQPVRQCSLPILEEDDEC